MHIQKILAFLGTAFLAMVLFSAPVDAASHKVQKGETLFSISKKYNTTVEQIKKSNKLRSNTLKIGQTLNIGGTTTTAAAKKTTIIAKKTHRMTATAFTAYCGGCSGITRTGINLKKNPKAKVIAVDPKVIPLGSKVYVEGYGEAIAGDTGSAIRGNKIDVFYPTKSQAYKWGRRTVTVTVLN